MRGKNRAIALVAFRLLEKEKLEDVTLIAEDHLSNGLFVPGMKTA